MDEHTVNLIRDQLAAINRNTEALHRVVSEHVQKDERYWQKIDEQRGQVSTLKWLLGPGIAGFFGWLYNTLIKS